MSTVKNKPFAITLNVGSSLANKTGSWRTARPVYLDRLPPCNNQCPAGENIQSWLYLAEEGNYEQAWRKIMEENPFPAIMGRVCYHTCEGACNRGKVDLPVGINSVERFLGDQALKYGWTVAPGKPTGKKVMVLGVTGDITTEYLNGVENQRGELKPSRGDLHDVEDGQLDLNLASDTDN